MTYGLHYRNARIATCRRLNENAANRNALLSTYQRFAHACTHVYEDTQAEAQKLLPPTCPALQRCT